ncbi:transglutaminase domain-containing protein [Candidatus Gottesmanbacteria bacterium]|nr:transglutaminase domain-containing protein [Candidatus Gottesmanbacteria bacterium]
MKFFKIVIFILLSIIYYLLSLPSAFAAGEFSPAYDVIYDVKETGQTIVTQNIHLTNLTTNYYASEYTLTFGTEKINNVSAWDGQGPLKVDIKKGTDLTQIHVAFNEKVVGQGKTLNWGLRYQSEEIGKRMGRIWEINIPRVSAEEQATAYNVTLIVPSDFGQPAYVWPKPKKPFYWTINEGSRQGITIGFGDWQGFRFDLAYHLENSQMIPGTIDIALPPDTLYQKIILDKIDPPPSDIIVDEDGNWLAKYFLLPGQKQDIKVNGLAQIFLTPRTDYPKEDSQQIRQKYLKSQKYWEQDEEINQLARELKIPEAIYNYVVSTLTYDYQRASGQTSRLGAKQALLTPNKAICMEFTDLFIALSRAAGIPAREVDGYAYTSNSRLKPLSLLTDVLHSWPEYWDSQKNIWVQIDPTWGKTSLIDYFNRFDFNHLAFVKRGVDSTSPYPGKDVLVDFSPDFPLSPSKPPEIQSLFPKWVIAGLPLTGSLKLKNENKVALYNLNISLKDKNFYLPVLPPLAEKVWEVKLENSNLFSYGKNLLTASVGEQKTEIAFQIIPLPLLLLPIVLGFFVLILLTRLAIKKFWMGEPSPP